MKNLTSIKNGNMYIGYNFSMFLPNSYQKNTIKNFRLNKKRPTSFSGLGLLNDGYRFSSM